MTLLVFPGFFVDKKHAFCYNPYKFQYNQAVRMLQPKEGEKSVH